MIRQYQRMIAAGQVVKIDGMGEPEFVHFRECSDVNALIKILATNSQGQDVIDAQLLAGQGFTGNQIFSHLSLKNESAAAIIATFVVGSGAFTDERVNGEISTKVSGLFRPLSDLIITGSSQGIAENVMRKAITLYASEDNSQIIHIGSAGASIPLKAGGSIVLETTAYIPIRGGGNGDKLHAIEI